MDINKIKKEGFFRYLDLRIKWIGEKKNLHLNDPDRYLWEMFFHELEVIKEEAIYAFKKDKK